jgi:hypothetical protein
VLFSLQAPTKRSCEMSSRFSFTTSMTRELSIQVFISDSHSWVLVELKLDIGKTFGICSCNPCQCCSSIPNS